ncbi:unnamed protein product [Amoebophrya sp. A120]|nr:unnamed protein product [Amoebophrya sp. A120]|eukprot:GSA120T00020426001.1
MAPEDGAAGDEPDFSLGACPDPFENLDLDLLGAAAGEQPVDEASAWSAGTIQASGPASSSTSSSAGLSSTFAGGIGSDPVNHYGNAEQQGDHSSASQHGLSATGFILANSTTTHLPGTGPAGSTSAQEDLHGRSTLHAAYAAEDGGTSVLSDHVDHSRLPGITSAAPARADSDSVVQLPAGAGTTRSTTAVTNYTFDVADGALLTNANSTSLSHTTTFGTNNGANPASEKESAHPGGVLVPTPQRMAHPSSGASAGIISSSWFDADGKQAAKKSGATSVKKNFSTSSWSSTSTASSSTSGASKPFAKSLKLHSFLTGNHHAYSGNSDLFYDDEYAFSHGRKDLNVFGDPTDHFFHRAEPSSPLTLFLSWVCCCFVNPCCGFCFSCCCPKKLPGGRYLEKLAFRTSQFLEESQVLDPLFYLNRVLPGSINADNNVKYHKVLAPIAFVYCFFQVFALLAQFHLLAEVGWNSAVFLRTLNENCGSSTRNLRNGVCVGGTTSNGQSVWKKVYDDVVEFYPTTPRSAVTTSVGNSEDFSADSFEVPPDKAFPFITNSHPATFLVGVEPQSPNSHAKYKLAVTKPGGDYVHWARTPKMVSERVSAGVETGVFVAQDDTSFGSDFTGGDNAWSTWQGRIELTSSHQESANDYPIRFRVYVLDNNVNHLQTIHNQDKCNFITTWEAFSKKSADSEAWYINSFFTILLFFFATQMLSLFLILWRYCRFADGSKMFTKLVLLKFLLQDLPLQLCAAVYLHAWYGQNGMRCQMCLFDEDHCNSFEDSYDGSYENANPVVVWQNQVLFFSLIFSAISVQLFLDPSRNRSVMAIYDSFTLQEDEKIFTLFIRFLLFSLSILPLSTGYCLFSGSSSGLFHQLEVTKHAHTVHKHFFLHLLLTISCVSGWMTVLALPFCCCEEDEDF